MITPPGVWFCHVAKLYIWAEASHLDNMKVFPSCIANELYYLLSFVTWPVSCQWLTIVLDRELTISWLFVMQIMRFWSCVVLKRTEDLFQNPLVISIAQGSDEILDFICCEMGSFLFQSPTFLFVVTPMDWLHLPMSFSVHLHFIKWSMIWRV